MTATKRQIEALDRVLELTVLLGEDMDAGLAADGLTVARTHLLWVLRALGASTQRALAEALQVSPRNVTGLVDGLVSTGFVTREAHPDDRRATLVTFTEHGAGVIERMAGEQAQFAASLFSGLSSDQLTAFMTGLDSVVSRLKVLVEEAKK